jgi:pimeloyl-ACP methyl ester carboxylesterase
VVAFDLPAHGASTDRRMTLPEGVQAVEAVARTQPGLKAILAHSFGGVLTTVALARGLDCERVVLLASPAEMELYLQRLERGVGLGQAGQAAFRARIDRVLSAAGMANVSLASLVPALSQPALIVHDASDLEVPVSAARRLARAWPGAECVETQGLGHRRLLQSPEVVARVQAFVTGAKRQLDRPVAVPALRAL